MSQREIIHVKLMVRPIYLKIIWPRSSRILVGPAVDFKAVRHPHTVRAHENAATTSHPTGKYPRQTHYSETNQQDHEPLRLLAHSFSLFSLFVSLPSIWAHP